MVNPDASVTGPAAMPAPELVIDARGIVTRFGKQVVHNGLDLQIRRGDLVALIGGSGTGKSVLLREIIGLHRPDSGSVNLLGTDVWTASPDMLAAVRRRFGMMFQEGALFSSLTVAANVATPLREHFSLPEDLLDELNRTVARQQQQLEALARELVRLRGQVEEMGEQDASGDGTATRQEVPPHY